MKKRQAKKLGKIEKWAQEVKVYDDELLDAAVDNALKDVVVRPKLEGEEKFRERLDAEHLNGRPIGEIVDELNADNPDADPTKSYLELSDLERGERLTFAMNRLALLLERSRFSDYVAMMGSTKQMMYKHFMAGMARGLGYAIGFVFLAAVALYLFQLVAGWGLPVISDWLQDIAGYMREIENYRKTLGQAFGPTLI